MADGGDFQLIDAVVTAVAEVFDAERGGGGSLERVGDEGREGDGVGALDGGEVIVFRLAVVVPFDDDAAVFPRLISWDQVFGAGLGMEVEEADSLQIRDGKAEDDVRFRVFAVAGGEEKVGLIFAAVDRSALRKGRGGPEKIGQVEAGLAGDGFEAELPGEEGAQR